MTKRITAALPGAFIALAVAGVAAAEGPQPGAHFIQNWDQNGDGRVVLAEAETMRDNLFSSFDGDDDGILSAEEYDALDAARAADLADQPERAQAALGAIVGTLGREFNDANGDGTVSRDEFVTGAADWLHRLDADGDNGVTTADFAALLGKSAN